MEQDEGSSIGLSTMLKLSGVLPVMLGVLIVVSPRTTLTVGSNLTESGIYVSQFLGVCAIMIGLAQWLVSIYVKENLHIFGRFFAFNFSMIALMDLHLWTTGLVDFELKYVFGTMFPIAGAFVLLLYSIKPEQSEMVTSNEN